MTYFSTPSSIRYGDNDGTQYSWLGINQGHHDISHAGDSDMGARANLIKIYTWYSQQVAHFLDKLASYPDVSCKPRELRTIGCSPRSAN